MKKLMAMAAFILATAAVQADPAYAFTYQAALRDEHGNVIKSGDTVVRNHTVTIRLWDAAVGGKLLWSRQYNVFTDETGLFNLAVGDNEGSAASDAPTGQSLENVFTGHSAGGVWVGLEVKDSAGEIQPRQRIFAAPFAAVANDVRKISGNVNVGGTITLGSGSARTLIHNAGISQTGGTSEFDAVVVNNTLGARTATLSDGLTVNGGTVTIKTNLNIASGKKVLVGDAELLPVPVGGIIMWSKSSLPDNEHWAVCDGKTYNGVKTPDLSARFIVGVGNGYALGSTGGEEKHKLTVSEMPSHRHEWVGDDQLEGIDNGFPSKVRSTATHYDADSVLNKNHDSKVYNTASTGGDVAHENRPPYYALYYIMRIK